LLLGASQLVGLLAAAVQNPDGDGSHLNVGANVAKASTQYNYLNHQENEERWDAKQGCDGGNEGDCAKVDELDALDKKRDQDLKDACRENSAGANCAANIAAAEAAVDSLRKEKHSEEATDQYRQAAEDPELRDYTLAKELRDTRNLIDSTPHTTPEAKALVHGLVGVMVEFSPAGGLMALADAEDPFDYVIAAVESVPAGKGVSVLIKEAKALYQAGKVDEAARIVSEVASANKAIGFTPDAAETAVTGMRNGGGHAIRQLEGNIIPNNGSLQSRVDSFKDVALPIFENLIHASDWRIGGTQGRAFLGNVNGENIVIVVAKSGPHQGKVISSFVPDEDQLNLILSR